MTQKCFCLPTDTALRWVLGFLFYFSLETRLTGPRWIDVGGVGVTGQEVWPDESTVASGSVGCSLRARLGGWSLTSYSSHSARVVLKVT